MLSGNISRNSGGALCFAGHDTAKLAEKYGKSPAQIILRWAVQMDIITIPGSKNPDHIRANFDIFDFALTADEMQEIAKLDGTKRYYHPSDSLEESYAQMPLHFQE